MVADSNPTSKEMAMFNAKLAGLVVAGVLFAGAVQAAPGSVDDAGVRLPVRGTYSDMLRGMAGENLAAFPASVDDSGVRLPVRSTRVYTGTPRESVTVFPGMTDDAGRRL
jgi:hypothetical protein